MEIKRLWRGIFLFISFILYFITDGEMLAEELRHAGDEERIYIIKKGDTLWDISGEYLKNPFLWPDIWRENKYINNPDLIYPDNRLIIPLIIPFAPMSGEVDASLTPAEATAPAPAAPFAPTVSLAPVPHSPPSPPLPVEPGGALSRPPVTSVIGSDLIFGSGYIMDNIESSGIITGSPEGRNIFANGDSVNVLLYIEDTSEISVGDRFTIFRKPAYISHPKTGKRVGMLFIPVGVLEIYRAQGRDAAGRIIRSYDYISPGDLIQPYQPASAVSEISEAVSGVYGYIIKSFEGKVLNAEYDIVYLDKGASDGITPGTGLYVIGERHDYIIGELKVISVQATTSTALVIKSIEPFGIGSKVVTPSK